MLRVHTRRLVASCTKLNTGLISMGHDTISQGCGRLVAGNHHPEVLDRKEHETFSSCKDLQSTCMNLKVAFGILMTLHF